MKSCLLFLAIGATVSIAVAESPQVKPVNPDPPRVSAGVPAPASTETFVYDQRPVGGRPVLISPEQAQNVIARFKTNYASAGSPRIVIFVNRDLVDEQSGLKLSSRTERTQSNRTDVKSEFKADPSAPTSSATQVPPASNVTIVGDVSGTRRSQLPGTGTVNTTSEKSTRENTYKLAERNNATLADKQTVRDVERLFGRPLRMAGANLADQRVAAQLLENKGSDAAGYEQARRDREALSQVADIALEVLISSRDVTASELSGDRVYTVPDIQATAVRLKDSRILGQATATDIIGKDRYAGNIARNFDVREIAEATALALMEDMLLSPQ